MAGDLMEREIRQQPAALRDHSERYLTEARQALKDANPEMVLLVARGSSDNASLFARYLIEIHLGVPVSLAAPSVVTRYASEMRYPRCLTIGVSQSGAAPDVSEVVAAMRRQGHPTLALTNTPGSRLCQEAEHDIAFGLDEERSVAATKTYTASLLALYQIVRALGADLPNPILPTDADVDRAFEAADLARGPLLRARTRFALARGYDFCTAYEAALKLTECALLQCAAYSTADFQHGPRALASYGAVALSFGEPPTGLEDTGCELLPAPQLDPHPSNPLRDVIFGQALALGAGRALGLDPDLPRLLAKVTRTL